MPREDLGVVADIALGFGRVVSRIEVEARAIDQTQFSVELAAERISWSGPIWPGCVYQPAEVLLAT